MSVSSAVTMMRKVSSVTAPVRRLTPSRPRRAPGQAAVWTLSATTALGAALLFAAGARDAHAAVRSVELPFWLLLLGFAAAERFVVHVHFRHSAHSMSLGEVPLVFGLLFTGGQTVILAGLLGRLAVLALHRRLPPVRLAFNFATFFLGNCLAVLVFHAVAGAAAELGPATWVAATLATAASSVTAALLISAAVSLTEGMLGLRLIVRTLSGDLAVTTANTSVALCAATLVFHDWKAAFLMAVPLAGMFATLRAYLAERQRHERLEFLYDTARTLSRSADMGPALEGLLARALEAFRAEVAELIFFSPDGSDALRTTVRASGAARVLEPVEPSIVEELRRMIEGQVVRAAAMSEIADGRLAEYLRSRELSAGMFAVLEGERASIGAMMLGNPSGVVHRFSSDDLKLFETLANNTSVALENDRLGQTVWRMKELQRELEHQASHDPLTDIPNRALFTARVREALERDGSGVSVIFIDIDDFKTVNDSLGHAAGDALLIAAAKRLRECARPSDVVARLGGDEFAVMLAAPSSLEDATAVAQRVTRRLTNRFRIGGENVTVHASAGIAASDGANVGPEELIRNADVAMYRAKQAGKNGYVVFEPGMEVPVMRRHGLKQRLREAVKEDSFAVHYQPIVALASGEVVACEALVRWLDGPRGPVAPHAFIPMAEEMGVIVQIGRSVLRRACADAHDWAGAGASGAAVHVNLSPVELRDRGFLSGVATTLELSGLSPSQLVLEITENVVLREPKRSVATLSELRSLGARVALDDFGTGYSSLSHLRELPIDCLKFGRPFVDLFEPGGIDRPFVRTMVELAGSLGIDVVAEGIESAEQLDSLLELGCGFGQGFHLGVPVELEAGGDAPRVVRAPAKPTGPRAPRQTRSRRISKARSTTVQ